LHNTPVRKYLWETENSSDGLTIATLVHDKHIRDKVRTYTTTSRRETTCASLNYRLNIST